MNLPFWRAFAVVVAVTGLCALAAAFWAHFRPPYVVALGTPIRHDDFLFTVIKIRAHRLPDRTTVYRVDVKVNSEAKVVNYQWRDDIAYVRAFDSAGFGHDFYPSTHGSFIVPPGQERTAHLEFRIPPDVSSANLRFWDGIFMGDALNGAAYAKAIVPLADYHPPFGT